MTTLARKVIKSAYFFLVVIAIGHILGSPYIWVNHEFGYKIVHLFYGNTDAGAENIEHIFFYIGFIITLFLSVIFYIMTIKLIKKIRS
ncbi:hypothetical protein TUM12370_11870 [Salmonella enterica subsp. enterica serovar Choleraesuis]|nr:hypothetical protein TUM12370_11870 [Salmonella enterica subsp. enterica serovar Choleraesuis]